MADLMVVVVREACGSPMRMVLLQLMVKKINEGSVESGMSLLEAVSWVCCRLVEGDDRRWVCWLKGNKEKGEEGKCGAPVDGALVCLCQKLGGAAMWEIKIKVEEGARV
uniref:Uncharacterized protein n=1 Tax=Populus alba TaxID=43335 RepID=A0A4U5QBV3_POPAL|nr:hypothetical protein D5086_0000109770 [Populus alba]